MFVLMQLSEMHGMGRVNLYLAILWTQGQCIQVFSILMTKVMTRKKSKICLKRGAAETNARSVVKIPFLCVAVML